MTKYAIYEVNSLLRNLSSPIDERSLKIRYLCALFAELAYYYVPEWEIDDRKRAKLIPCEAYRAIVAGATARNTDPTINFQSLELQDGFVIEDRGVVAVGLLHDRLLFIGFRGTQFLFDWGVNLRAKLIPVKIHYLCRPQFSLGTLHGRFHSGFAEEATRISTRILDKIRCLNVRDIDHVFLTGHSLGGAVAAISGHFVRVAPTSVCILGAPRYSDLSAYISMLDIPTIQVRRTDDVVPTVPPRAFGYADHPYEFTTSGVGYIDSPLYSSTFIGLYRWAQFLGGRCRSHDIESYRKELGEAAGAQYAEAPLAPIGRLTIENVVSATT